MTHAPGSMRAGSSVATGDLTSRPRTIARMRARPDRIYQARRDAALRRLADRDHLGDERAERLVATWEAEADRLGLDPDTTAFWEAAQRWIEERR